MTFFSQVKLDLFLTYSGIPDQDGLNLEGSSAPGNEYRAPAVVLDTQIF